MVGMRARIGKAIPTFSALAGLALLWLAIAGCFPGSPTATPEPAEPPGRFAEVIVEPARRPVATAVPAMPTLASAPTPVPALSQPADPTATVEAIPAPTTAGPDGRDALVADRQALEALAFGYLKELAIDVGVRESGTDLERAAAEFLTAKFEELGYSPEAQEFSWDSPSASVSIGTPAAEEAVEELEANTLSGTANGAAAATLAFVGLGKPEDMPAEGLAGKIALIERGEVTFGSKVAQAHRAGAVAAIIFNNRAGNFQGTLGGRGQIPAVSISRSDGNRLKELLAGGNVVEATVSVMDNAVPSRNLLAELPGTGQGVVVVGAHYDTVPDSVGASDNSSGLGAMLAVAERVAGRAFPFTLRFIAFGSEETGLHGSEYYVDQLTAAELNEIYAMINLDSVGSGSGLRVSGDRWLTRHLAETAQDMDIALSVRRGGQGGSDHANFRAAWVPVVFFVGDDLSRINTPADTMEHVAPRLVGDATVLTLDLLENIANLPGYGQ